MVFTCVSVIACNHIAKNASDPRSRHNLDRHYIFDRDGSVGGWVWRRPKNIALRVADILGLRVGCVGRRAAVIWREPLDPKNREAFRCSRVRELIFEPTQRPGIFGYLC